MGMSSRPIAVTWDASPEAVSAALSRAIVEERYEDAGDDTVTGWRAFGVVDGRTVDIRMTSIGAPGTSGYGLVVNVRGELIEDHGGTRLMGRADATDRGLERWIIPIMLVFLTALPVVAVAVQDGPLAALAAAALLFAVVLVPGWLLATFVISIASRSYLSVAPRLEAVLACLGTQ